MNIYLNDFISKNTADLFFLINIRQRNSYAAKIHPKMVGISSRYYAWQGRDNVARNHAIVTYVALTVSLGYVVLGGFLRAGAHVHISIVY